jgi:hypothetical protein
MRVRFAPRPFCLWARQSNSAGDRAGKPTRPATVADFTRVVEQTGILKREPAGGDGMKEVAN